MKRHLLLLTFFLLCFTGMAQNQIPTGESKQVFPFEQWQRMTEEYMKLGYYSNAMELYKKMDSLPGGITELHNLMQFFICAECLQDYALADSLICRFARHPLCSQEDLGRLKMTQRLRALPIWQELIAVANDKTTLCQPFIDELKVMAEADQAGRIRLHSAKNEKEVQAIWKEISTTDSLNLIRLKALIDQYGFPTFSLVGYEGQSEAWLIAQHSDPDYLSKYLRRLKKAALKGDASMIDYAYMLDRDRDNCGLPQIYGSQLIETKDGTFFQPIANLDKLNQRRAEIHLEPIESYLTYYGLKEVKINPATYDYAPYYDIRIQAETALAQHDTAKAYEFYKQLTGSSNYYLFPIDRKRMVECLVQQGKYDKAMEETRTMLRAGCWRERIHINDSIDSSLDMEMDELNHEYLTLQVDIEGNDSLMLAMGDLEKLKALLRRRNFPRYSYPVWEGVTLLKELFYSGIRFEDEEIFDLLRTEVKKGNITPEYFAEKYDMLYLKLHGKQYYAQPPSYGEPSTAPIYRPKCLEKRRKKLGLPPVWVSKELTCR